MSQDEKEKSVRSLKHKVRALLSAGFRGREIIDSLQEDLGMEGEDVAEFVHAEESAFRARVRAKFRKSGFKTLALSPIFICVGVFGVASGFKRVGVGGLVLGGIALLVGLKRVIFGGRVSFDAEKSAEILARASSRRRAADAARLRSQDDD
jgi:hypothetical protein